MPINIATLLLPNDRSINKNQNISRFASAMSNNALQPPRGDPVADWKAFQPDKIPTKGGSLEKMPALFLETLERLEGQQKQKIDRITVDTVESSHNDNALPKDIQKKKSHYPEFLSILELGCGCGELSSSLQLRGHSVHGIDVNEAAIEKAKATANANLQAQKNADRSTITSGNETCALGSVLGTATFEVADIASNAKTESSSLQQHHQRYDFCVLQFLLSVVGGHDRRRQTLATARNSLKPGGTLYLSCSGVSDSINPNYKVLYQQDASDLFEEHGEHSYYSRDDTTRVLYVTHHFTCNELESLLSEAGFGRIRIDEKKETSSRRPEEQAYFLYATAVAE